MDDESLSQLPPHSGLNDDVMNQIIELEAEEERQELDDLDESPDSLNALRKQEQAAEEDWRVLNEGFQQVHQ